MLLAMVVSDPPFSPYWQVPRLRAERRWLSGVASAIALELGLEALWIRLAFVLLTLVSGAGLGLYAFCWLWFSYHARRHPERVAEPVPKGATPASRALGVCLVVLGLTIALDRLLSSGMGEATIWPVAVSVFGVLMVWSSGKVDWAAPNELVRATIGLLLIAAGVIAFVVSNLGLSVAPKALVISTVILAAVMLVVAPWLWRAASQVSEERLKRIRADERAELAAHLHDSVLQTLSLIQRNAADKHATINLARRQERELRQWLFGPEPGPSGVQQFRAALLALGAEVEQLHQLEVEVVVVGDGGVDRDVQTALSAVRELLVNAATHSGAGHVDVYGEISATKLEIFVRDKGKGFDPRAVPADRRGLSDSVVKRIERIGGSVTITSSTREADHGTEVALSVPRGGQP